MIETTPSLTPLTVIDPESAIVIPDPPLRDREPPVETIPVSEIEVLAFKFPLLIVIPPE